MKTAFVEQDIFDKPYGYDPFIVNTPPLNAVGVEVDEEVPGQKPLHQITGDDLDYLEARGIRRKARKAKRKTKRAARKQKRIKKRVAKAKKKGKTRRVGRLQKKSARIKKRTTRKVSRLKKKVARKTAKVKKRTAKKSLRILKRTTKAKKKGKTARAKKLEAKLKKVRARSAVKTATTRKSAKAARKKARPIRKQFRKARRSAVKQAAKKVGLAPFRTAFLGLLEINAWGLASMYGNMKAKNSPDYKKSRDKFEKLGGKGNEFDKYVDKGKSKKALKLPLTKLIQRKASMEGGGNYLNFEPATATAAIAAAAGIIVAMLNAIGKKPKDLDSETVNELKSNAVPESELNDLISEEEQAGTLGESDDPELQEGSNKLWLILGIVGGALLLGTILYFAFRKKN